MTNIRLLITGGTGSFGKAFTRKILQDPRYSVDRLVIFSRDELKQWQMSMDYPESKYPQVRFFLGDIRDLGRLRDAMEGITHVVHAAALKQVPAAEYNPMEFIKTNVLGSQNVISAALDKGVQAVVALSTDKASSPINLYGASKLCADKLFLSANNIRGSRNIRFSVVRYGNVMGSRGSVMPYFQELARQNKPIKITSEEMTRFNITLDHGCDIVIDALGNSSPGELIVPKLPSYRITDVARAIAPEAEIKIIGIRPGEKIHEEMISRHEN